METPKPKPEIVIGLVGPVGTDLRSLAQRIEEKIKAFDYRSAHIRVSELIRIWCEDDVKQKLERSRGFDRYINHMHAGDALRKLAAKGDALIPLVVASIIAFRKKFNAEDGINEDIHALKVCYIIDSLKNPDEVQTLRRLYGRSFVLISAFDSEDARRSNLKDIIAKSNLSAESENFDHQAAQLIELDSKRPGEKIGQNVRETFPLGDFFIRISGNFNSELERFIDLIFGSPYITPKRAEYFMFEAAAISNRSADLSRQVGAVIVSPNHEVISAGCNEVPRAGGGSYWPDEETLLDNRDYIKGKDFNAVKKYDIIKEVIQFLVENKVVVINENFTPDGCVTELLNGKYREKFKDLRISNLIEFGRVVHAEMNALMRAAQRGIPVDQSDLYSTTFPCHMCARHIIAAGIKRVIYIEPYPKSMTAELFPETVSIDNYSTGISVPCRGQDSHLVKPLVRFDPFEGVAPSIFQDVFRMNRRKDAYGYAVNWIRADAQPKLAPEAEGDLSVELTVQTSIAAVRKVRLDDIQLLEGSGNAGN